MSKIRYTCPDCGGERIAQDAYLWLNTGETTTYDSVICDDCGHEVTPIETDEDDARLVRKYNDDTPEVWLP